MFCFKCGHKNENKARFCQGCGENLVSITRTGRLKTGDMLDNRYEIKRMIKSGGMGSVYEALDHRFEKAPCAVKEMLSQTSSERQQQYMIERFSKEAKILHDLRHPHLPVVKDYFVEAGRYYLVMDYIEGRDLEIVMRGYTCGGISEELVVKWSVQILEALCYLHNQDPPVIYRDLKPGNIMLQSSDQNVMLVDFGIARTISPDNQATMTVVGTPAFAPAELFDGKADPRSDLYSLGATMHCLLTGVIPTKPFAFKPVREHNEKISKELEEIVMCSLEMEAEKRFGCARKMREALVKFIDKSSYPTAKLPQDIIEHSPTLLSGEMSSSSIESSHLPTLPSIDLSNNDPKEKVLPHESPLMEDEEVIVQRTIEVEAKEFKTLPLKIDSEDKSELAVKTLPDINLSHPVTLHQIPEETPSGADKQKLPEKFITGKKKPGAFKKIIIGSGLAVVIVFAVFILLSPSTPQSLYEKGIEASSNKDYKKAMEFFDKALELKPEYEKALSGKVEAFICLADDMALNGRYDEAIDFYNKAINFSPGDNKLLLKRSSVWKIQGDELCKEGRYEEAIDYYNKALKETPEYAEALACKKEGLKITGDTLYEEGKYEEAINRYNEALEIDNSYKDAWIGKGLSCGKLKNLKEAIKCFDKSIEIDPEDSQAFYYKGLALYYNKNLKEAIECYNTALQLNPDYAEAWTNKGLALAGKGDIVKAIECYDRSLSINSDSSETWNGKGNALYKQKKYEEAIVCYDNAIKVLPEFSKAILNKGNALFCMRKYEEAIACYDKVLKIEPESKIALSGKEKAIEALSML